MNVKANWRIDQLKNELREALNSESPEEKEKRLAAADQAKEARMLAMKRGRKAYKILPAAAAITSRTRGSSARHDEQNDKAKTDEQVTVHEDENASIQSYDSIELTDGYPTEREHGESAAKSATRLGQLTALDLNDSLGEDELLLSHVDTVVGNLFCKDIRATIGNENKLSLYQTWEITPEDVRAKLPPEISSQITNGEIMARLKLFWHEGDRNKRYREHRGSVSYRL